MPTALFVSPHLDDAVFSAGGTLALLAREPGWEVAVWTVFTASVPAPRGFALRCQTDKGIPPDVDYLALRRAEDHAAAVALGTNPTHWRHGPFPEAPHRGYRSPAELFAGEKSDDAIWQPVAHALRALADELRPTTVFAPQGLGNHVDHLQVIRAVCAVTALAGHVAWWRDTPYALREPSAKPAASLLPSGLRERVVALPDGALTAKIAASAAYTSQIGFQFGGPDALREKLTDFHRREAEGTTFAERFLAPPGLALPLWER